MERAPAWRAPSQLVAVSMMEMLIGGATFSSLGMLLPLMVRDLGLSWSGAGLGFTVLGACCGLASAGPPILIRRFGVSATFALGALMMGLGLATLFHVRGLTDYLLGTALCGFAYALMSGVPATYVITRLFTRRAGPLGVYGVIGGLGNAAAPWAVLGILAVTAQSWRLYWLFQCAVILLSGLAVAALVGLDPRFRGPARDDPPVAEAAPPSAVAARVYRTARDWTVRQALRTPQLYVLFAASIVNLFCLITVTSLSVGHLIERGVTPKLAGAMLSLEATVAIIARAAAGALGDRFEPRLLLGLALGAMSAGCLMLAFGRSQPWLLCYAIGTGIGFGVTILTGTLVLLNYFGQRHSLEIISAAYFTTTLASLGPLMGGMVRDITGSFTLMFVILAAASGLVSVAVLLMRPPAIARLAGE